VGTSPPVSPRRTPTWLISGYDGGTAHRRFLPSNIRHSVGTRPAETHQTLVLNNLRSRFMSSRRQLKTAATWPSPRCSGGGIWFATAPLVSLGCLMMACAI